MKHCTAEQFPMIYREGEGVQLKKLSHRHLAIMDWMLANPREKLGACADYFRVSAPWLSTVVNSDLFKERMAERRSLMEEHQTSRITQGLMDMAEDGILALGDVVKDKEIDPKTKTDITRMSLEALGFLGKRGGGVNVQFNNNVPPPPAVDRSSLVEAQQRMSRVVVDVPREAIDPPQDGE